MGGISVKTYMIVFKCPGRNSEIIIGTWLIKIGEKAVAEDEANTLNNKKVL